MVMGWGIPKAEAEKRLAGFAKRAGWANLPAIKNNRLYAAYHANSRTLSDSASIQFMAKAIYPQCLKISTLRRPIWTSTAKTCPSCRTARSTSIRKDNKVV